MFRSCIKGAEHECSASVGSVRKSAITVASAATTPNRASVLGLAHLNVGVYGHIGVGGFVLRL